MNAKERKEFRIALNNAIATGKVVRIYTRCELTGLPIKLDWRTGHQV